MMTASEKVFFDTSPFIYLLEDHPEYYSKVEGFMISAVQQQLIMVSSVLSIAEFGVKPEKENRQDLIESLNKLLLDFHFQLLDIDVEVARVSSRLRARHNHLKAMDALQLATASYCGCKYFLTNDKKLNRIKDLQVILLDDI